MSGGLSQVTARTLTGGDIFIVLASDGVWEFMKNQEASALSVEKRVSSIFSRLVACLPVLADRAYFLSFPNVMFRSRQYHVSADVPTQ